MMGVVTLHALDHDSTEEQAEVQEKGWQLATSVCLLHFTGALTHMWCIDTKNLLLNWPF